MSTEALVQAVEKAILTSCEKLEDHSLCPEKVANAVSNLVYARGDLLRQGEKPKAE